MQTPMDLTIALQAKAGRHTARTAIATPAHVFITTPRLSTRRIPLPAPVAQIEAGRAAVQADRSSLGPDLTGRASSDSSRARPPELFAALIAHPPGGGLFE